MKKNLSTKTRTIMKTSHAIIFGMAALLLGGCYPQGPEYVDELDIVYTNHSQSFDFQTLSTFALPDQVVKITNSSFDPDEGEPEYVDPAYANVILNVIRNNMISNGWTEVDVDDSPDVMILPSVSTTTNIYFYYDWGYWDWWYPGWFDGWWWYYPGYYYPGSISGYRTGSLFIQMTDVKTPRVNNNVAVPWSAIINGLLEGSTASINDRLENTINQAFIQSSYLRL